MKLYLDYERISHHQSMLSDKIRTYAFKRAISQVVKPENIVVDIGTGTGILAFFATKAGAKEVYAIERTDIINVAKRIAKDNNIKNIVFIKKDAAKVNLENKCDVIVSECIGYFALQENMLSDVISFRKKNLKKEGVIIPSKIDLFMSLVCSETAYNNITFWGNKLYDFNFSALRKIAVNSTYHLFFSSQELVSKGILVKTIDMACDLAINLDEYFEVEVNKSCIVHGLCGYFSTMLVPGIVLSNSPLERSTHWKCEFFPFVRPLVLKNGQKVKVKIKAKLHKAFVDWEWSAETEGQKISQSTQNGARLKELV